MSTLSTALALRGASVASAPALAASSKRRRLSLGSKSWITGFSLPCGNVVEHLLGVEGEINFFPHVVMIRAQHGVGLPDKDRAHGAVAHRLELGALPAGENLGAGRQSSVALETDANRDLALIGVLHADRRIPQRHQLGAQRVDFG